MVGEPAGGEEDQEKRGERDGADSWLRRGEEAAAALAETWESLVHVCRGLRAQQWDWPTECPGWTVKDQLSHLIGIERSLLGEAPPAWDAPLGDHVRNAFARENEPWIATRRAQPGPVVLAEFVAVTDLRLATLRRLGEEEWAGAAPPSSERCYADFMKTGSSTAGSTSRTCAWRWAGPGGPEGWPRPSEWVRSRRQWASSWASRRRRPRARSVRFAVRAPPAIGGASR